MGEIVIEYFRAYWSDERKTVGIAYGEISVREK